MDFFTAPPAHDREPEEERVLPPWLGPSDTVLGRTVDISRTLFHSEALAIVLTSAVAFPEGVKLHVRIVARPVEGVNKDTWWERRDLMFERSHSRFRPGKALEDEILRFGVRFSDGGKATTVDGRPRYDGEWPPPPPDGPVLQQHSGGGGSGSDRLISLRWSLWLWPLPPAEPFEVAVEWPAFDVPLTFTEIDGAAIAAAAEHARPYWP
ncbi:hypothetical protein AB0G15_35925 [Streptosporangium sp. NPDC023825]|uniref:hypothetical protein n=1 Tax=Streptosporangium sp. NPDC023825 TaxID=3154909 RepID=UPI003443BA23